MSSALSTLLRKELTEFRADRKAMLFAVFLPVLLYPLMFWIISIVEGGEEEAMASRRLTVALTGSAPLVRAALQDDEGLKLTEESDPDSLRALIRRGSVEAWLDFPEGIASVRADSIPAARMVFRGTHSESQEAQRRLHRLLREIREAERERRYAAVGGEGRLGDVLRVRTEDIATREESGGARAGRSLVYFLIMTLFMSGSAIATDIVAGEKERGTLETLYLIPHARRSIAWSKYLVVIAATTVSGMLSLASISMCYRFGLVGGENEPAFLSASAIFAAALLILPLALLVGGVLLGLSSYARSLKEAQYFVMPAMLITFIPGLLAMSQAIELNTAMALVPVANVAFAMRDVLTGQYSLGMVSLAALASFGWGALAMRWVSGLLSREEMVLGFDPEPFLARTRSGRRRAALLAMALTVLGYFYIGNLLQAGRPLLGLTISLWVLLPALGAASLWLARNGGELRSLLCIRAPSVASLLGAVLLGIGVLLPVYGGLMPLQSRFLPAPEAFGVGLEAIFGDVPTWKLLVLMALSPAICEELVFRGAFLGLLRRVGSTRSAVILSSVFFGIIHLSVFRFLPTFAVGLIMGWIVVRTRSLLPSIVFHALYNGSLLVAARIFADRSPPLDPAGALAWALSLTFVLLGGWLVTRGTPGIRRAPE